MIIQSIYLKDLVFKKTPHYRKGQTVSFDFAIDIDAEYDDETRSIITTTTYETINHDDDSVYPFNFRILMTGEFALEDQETDVELIEKLKYVNCPAVTFPYLREAIASTVCKAGFPPLHIPLINFIQLNEQRKAQASSKQVATRTKTASKKAKK